MPVCQHCNTEWTSQQTFKKIFTFKRSLTCPECDATQYLSRRSRNHMSILAMIPLVIGLPLVGLSLPASIIISIQLAAFAAILAWMPTIYTLTSEEEAMW
ncbi:TIGR04104 family putative zinc finger protein [Rossellomorea marisflavi]|uniref:TIGR04104 family putative zinc finger protein n=1 Tax=Rossellomorea marisflavi TaxID=189381 RepID=UPI003D2F28C3